MRHTTLVFTKTGSSTTLSTETCHYLGFCRGFTSPGAQSPQSNPGTPKRLSYTEDTGDTRRLGGQSTAGLSAQERAIRFEISPSTSVTSQGSLPGSRSDSPAPGVRRTLSDWIRGNVQPFTRLSYCSSL